MSPLNFFQMLTSRELGGGEVVALGLCEFLHRRGERSVALIPGRGPAWDAARSRNLDVLGYDLDGALAPGKLRSAMANAGLYRRLGRRGPGGLVHVHAPHVYGALRHALRWSGLKTVVHVHLASENGGFEWALREPPDLAITCAKFFRETVAEAIPEERRAGVRIAAAPNAVDVERLRPGRRADARRRLGFAGDAPLVLMLANLSPHKGQETAIRAVAELKRRRTSVCCWLAGAERDGGGAYAAWLRGLAAELGVGENVELLGHRRDASELLAAADVLVLPSTNEGLPLSLLEAQAAGTPVIAAPTAGVPEIVEDGQTGFLVEAGDAAGYAAKIELLLAQPELAQRIAAAARTRVDREHSWPAYGKRILELYQELLEAPAAITKERAKRPTISANGPIH